MRRRAEPPGCPPPRVPSVHRRVPRSRAPGTGLARWPTGRARAPPRQRRRPAPASGRNGVLGEFRAVDEIADALGPVRTAVRRRRETQHPADGEVLQDGRETAAGQLRHQESGGAVVSGTARCAPGHVRDAQGAERGEGALGVEGVRRPACRGGPLVVCRPGHVKGVFLSLPPWGHHSSFGGSGRRVRRSSCCARPSARSRAHRSNRCPGRREPRPWHRRARRSSHRWWPPRTRAVP